MKTECPNCHQQYHLDASLAGQYVECGVCGKKWELLTPEQKFLQAKKQLHKVRRGCIAELLIRGVLIALSLTLIYLCFETGNIILFLAGIVVFLCSLVTPRKKPKPFYFICPNPNCGFKGDIEPTQDTKGMLKTAVGFALLQSLGFFTILHDSQNVACPRCGMLVKHSRK